MQAEMLGGGNRSVDPLILNSKLGENECSVLRPDHLNSEVIIFIKAIRPLQTTSRTFYLKTQSVPRSKHFSSRL